MKAAGQAVMAANTWGNRSKPMNTLNWEKLPTFKAGRTLWGEGGAATASLEQLLGGGKTLDLDVGKLEGMFAKPEVKAKVDVSAEADNRPKVVKVTLLDAKRSTSVGIVMKRITDALQGKELRDALMDVDENLLPLDVLPMVMEIAPTAEERTMLSGFSGDVTTLDKPEQMLRTLAFIPRLEGRLKAMVFKAQLEVDMDAVLMPRVGDLNTACERVRDCKELHALLQIGTCPQRAQTVARSIASHPAGHTQLPSPALHSSPCLRGRPSLPPLRATTSPLRASPSLFLSRVCSPRRGQCTERRHEQRQRRGLPAVDVAQAR